MRRTTTGVFTLLLGSGVAFAEAFESPVATSVVPAHIRSANAVAWDADAVRAAARRGERVVIEGVSLGIGRAVDLAVESASSCGPNTHFVSGRNGAPDVPLDVDFSAVTLLRGQVVGFLQSQVLLSISDERQVAAIDLEPGAPRYLLSSRTADGLRAAAADEVVVESVDTALRTAVPRCGATAAPSPAGDAMATSLPSPRTGLKHIELAVDTDDEYVALFGDVTLAAMYVCEVYEAVSDVFVTTADTRIELVFVRLWDQENDPFGAGVEPTEEFAEYWRANMGHVARDAAQLFSGRRDFPFGGSGFPDAMCTANAYSSVGYVLGFFPDPRYPSPYNNDVSVAAHELGHNTGAQHTHELVPPVDGCNDPLTVPQRGTIMSYCSQTWSGGNANEDMYFHARSRDQIRAHLSAAACVANDCNVNGVADEEDVLSGTSDDADGNDVPDECEDCNGNGILDDADVASGFSSDLDVDGRPDECQPDCNLNGVPDRRDIELGSSEDAYGNEVPDECETDCNRNGTSDYTEIQLDITRDLDRNAVLDACEDCDDDGVTDLVELDRAHDLWLGSGHAGPESALLHGFQAMAGVPTSTSVGAAIDQAQDVLTGPDGTVWVTSAGDERILQFDREGRYVRDLGRPGVRYPTPAGLALSPSGRLLVASRSTDSVLAFDAATGKARGAFVRARSGGLKNPFGLTFGPNGNLFVTSEPDAGEVLEYDGSTGEFVQTLVRDCDLTAPRGLTFTSDGNLLVASYQQKVVLEYDGRQGLPLGPWSQVGTTRCPPSVTCPVLSQVSPWGVRVGPNGNVFVSRTGDAFGPGGSGNPEDPGPDPLHLTSAHIYEFAVHNGLFLRAHVQGNDHHLEFATGFSFVPGDDTDCNRNHRPDACDVIGGTSQDANGNTHPDECEADCNGNGVFDRLDVIPFGSSFDCDFDRVPDECQGSGGPCSTAPRPTTCTATPRTDCLTANGGKLIVSQQTAAKSRVTVELGRFESAVALADLGDPLVAGGTRYDVCVYDDNDQRAATLSVEREPCTAIWRLSEDGSGYEYRDERGRADGVSRIVARSGEPSRARIQVKAKNNRHSREVPSGIAEALEGSSHVTIQVVTSDAKCFDAVLDVRQADGARVKAVAP